MIRASQNKITPTIAQVKTKIDTLKMLWRDWVKLGKQSGFRWNAKTELYEAADYV